MRFTEQLTASSIFNPIKDCFSKQKKDLKSKEFYQRKFPIIYYGSRYKLEYLIGDAIAGLTTALTLIPVVLGFSALANLPIQYGLYSSMLPGFVYAVLGLCPEVSTSIGPTAVLSLMSYSYAGNNIAYATTLNFISGIVILAAGIFNLGFLVNMVSLPVISGFTSAVCLQVASSQIKGLLGLTVKGRGFFYTWKAVFENLSLIRPIDAAFGIGSFFILLFLRNVKDSKCGSGDSTLSKTIAKIKWVITISRNFTILVVTSLLAYFLINEFDMPDSVIITGHIPSGLPDIQVPWNIQNNGTDVGFVEIVEELGSGCFMIPLVAYLQHISIVQFYSASSHDSIVDPTQEMFAIGILQILGSFVGSFSSTSSISRSAVNASSGVRTTFAGILTGTIIVIACIFLTPLLAYIPKASLSAIIIMAIIFTIDVQILKPLWRAKKIDIVPYALTFFLCLFWKVEFGLMFGSIFHLVMLAYLTSKPQFTKQINKSNNTSYIYIRPDRGLFFPASNNLQTEIKHMSDQSPNVNNIILDMSDVFDIDYSVAHGLKNLSQLMKKLDVNLAFCGINESVRSVLTGICMSEINQFRTLEETEAILCSSPKTS